MTCSSPDLVVVNGRPMVSSLTVAQRFGKPHKHVLRDIRDLLASLPEDLREPNFGLTQIEIKTPTGGVRKSPAYNLSRDGFTLLAMGFTGAQALTWKIRYIQAFNAMEAKLHAPAAIKAAAQELPDSPYIPGPAPDALAETFLSERVVVAAGQNLDAAVLYQAFQEWCVVQGVVGVPSSQVFNVVMGRHFLRHRSSRVCWLDAALRPDNSPACPRRAAPAALPAYGTDAAFFRQASRISADFYDVFREALVRCDELYREHRSLLRRHFPRAEQDHDVAELLRNFEGSGLSMIETADDAFNAALRQMRSAERVYRLAVRGRA